MAIKNFLRTVYIILSLMASGLINSALAAPPVLDSKDAQGLATELCMALSRVETDDNYDARENIDRKLGRYGNIEPNTPNLETKTAEFWNANSQNMICHEVVGSYPRQHVFKRAFEMSLHIRVLEEYFFRDETNFPIDPNVIEVLPNCIRRTVLDYIDIMISNKDSENRWNVGQIIGIRDILTDLYGAKRVYEMDAEQLALRSSLVKPVPGCFGAKILSELSNEEINVGIDDLSEFYSWYKPVAFVSRLPSPDELPISCMPADLDAIEGAVNEAYLRLQTDFVTSEKSADIMDRVSEIVMGEEARKIERVIKGAQKVTPREIKCFSHPHFGKVFRQQIETYYDGSRPNSIRHAVYWQTLYKGERNFTFKFLNE